MCVSSVSTKRRVVLPCLVHALLSADLCSPVPVVFILVDALERKRVGATFLVVPASLIIVVVVDMAEISGRVVIRPLDIIHAVCCSAAPTLSPGPCGG